MRTEFRAQLDRLTAELAEMCALAATAVGDATSAVVHADPDARGRVRTTLRRLDELNDHADRRAFSLLARHSPVAHDLRLVMSAFSIAANADRMGALAANIAKVGSRHRDDQPLPAVAVQLFAEMGGCAVDLAERAHRAVSSDDAVEAARICDGDVVINDLHRRLLAILTDGHWSAGVQAASDAVLLGRFYERFADNAVEIAQKIIFQASGEAPLTRELSR